MPTVEEVYREAIAPLPAGERFALAELILKQLQVERDGLLAEAIRVPLPPDVQERFNYLVSRRRTEQLTPAEHHELLTLTEQIEDIDVRRVEFMAQLAYLRDTSLQSVADEFATHRTSHDG